jgi:murein DD-endopeptidase MepM/ murein hydrolase activator NlpD
VRATGHGDRRTLLARGAIACVVAIALGSTAAPAQASVTLSAAEHRVRELTQRIHDRQAAITSFRRELGRIADRVDEARRIPSPQPWMRARHADVEISHATLVKRREARLRSLGRDRAAIQHRIARAQRAVAELSRARELAVDEVWRIRPIGRCPVQGPHVVSDDFGAPRWVDGKYHAHMGNDILAPYGTPIVAPFDGRAVASANSLGGVAVKVFGSAGYVYNAHLSRYGTLGTVSTGTVIGYVGATGDAKGGAPHDHFEWHPGGGGAVDPHALLLQVC